MFLKRDHIHSQAGRGRRALCSTHNHGLVLF